MLVSGAVALIVAQQLGWQGTYLLMAALMAIGVLVQSVGWAPFFLLTTVTALPGLLLLWVSRPVLLKAALR